MRKREIPHIYPEASFFQQVLVKHSAKLAGTFDKQLDCRHVLIYIIGVDEERPAVHSGMITGWFTGNTGGIGMQNIMVEAEKRNGIGGGHVKRLRKEGMVPAVIYGKGIDSIPIKIKMSDLRELVTTGGRNAFFTLSVEGMEHAAIIKDIQYDIIKSDVLHVDVQKVSLTEKIQSNVAIRIIGREKAESGGKVLIIHMDTVAVECFPQDTINHVALNVSELNVGDSLAVADLDLPESFTVLDAPNEMVVSVSEVREIEEPEEEETVEEEGLTEEEGEAQEVQEEQKGQE